VASKISLSLIIAFATLTAGTALFTEMPALLSALRALLHNYFLFGFLKYGRPFGLRGEENPITRLASFSKARALRIARRSARGLQGFIRLRRR
jgi:hypothetical protein